MSSMGAVLSWVCQYKEKEELMYSTSGAIMGSGQGPYERSPEGHERYVRMRHDMQGFENFKQTDILLKTKKKNQKKNKN